MRGKIITNQLQRYTLRSRRLHYLVLNDNGKQPKGEAKKPTESTDGDGNGVDKKAKSQVVNHVGDSKVKDDNLSEDNKTDPPIACDAFPNDLQKYRKATGHSSVDIGKVVICLNHSHYMCLSELFQCASMDEGQREIMETRLSELITALGPELCSQLVIDLKACECEETASMLPVSTRETNESMHLGDMVT